MRILNRFSAALLVVAAAACADAPPTATPEQPEPTPPVEEPPQAVGLYRLEVTGIGTGSMSSSVTHVPADMGDASASLTNAGAGLVFEAVSSGSFTEGARNAGGHRYVTFTYRIRNGTGAPLNNLTILLVQKASTIPGTPLFLLRKFDGTAANTAIATQVVPTGAVVLGSDLTSMNAEYPDVLQVFSEAEVGAVTPPAGVTDVFPVGYVVRHRTSTTDRTLPATSDLNQFDGVLTLAFRVPLQASAQQDVYSLGFEILAVTDSETRMTESIEESQDTAAVRRIRERAAALSATMVTVLNGSTVTDPAVPDYPGQRQICSPRTAGSLAAPVTRINNPAAYARVLLLRPGEFQNGCTAYFRTGTPDRPATNVTFGMRVTALDRYGNIRTAVTDTVRLEQASGPPATMGPAKALVNGTEVIGVTWSDYGTALVRAVGRRNEGWRPVDVMGVTRTWTAGAGTTNWSTDGNWSPAAVPMSLDSVSIPAAAPLDPSLVANVNVAGVTVEDFASIQLNAFDLTATGNVSTGLNGGITNTTGRLFLAGTAKTVQGVLPRIRVSGTYTLTGNVTARAPIQVDGGRITNWAYRVQAQSY